MGYRRHKGCRFEESAELIRAFLDRVGALLNYNALFSYLLGFLHLTNPAQETKMTPYWFNLLRMSHACINLEKYT